MKRWCLSFLWIRLIELTHWIKSFFCQFVTFCTLVVVTRVVIISGRTLYVTLSRNQSGRLPLPSIRTLIFFRGAMSSISRVNVSSWPLSNLDGKKKCAICYMFHCIYENIWTYDDYHKQNVIFKIHLFAFLLTVVWGHLYPSYLNINYAARPSSRLACGRKSGASNKTLLLASLKTNVSFA